jgi:hypothetical protein
MICNFFLSKVTVKSNMFVMPKEASYEGCWHSEGVDDSIETVGNS